MAVLRQYRRRKRADVRRQHRTFPQLFDNRTICEQLQFGAKIATGEVRSYLGLLLSGEI
jgi:hypothetical protein